MKILLLLLFLLFCLIVFVGINNTEKFTVDFYDYKEPYFGFCSPGITKEQWNSGEYVTKCWNNFAYEDCELLNQNNYNCGFSLKTGEKLKCKHFEGECKNEPQCFSSCYEQVGGCKGPYMIQVERNNLIGLASPQ